VETVTVPNILDHVIVIQDTKEMIAVLSNNLKDVPIIAVVMVIVTNLLVHAIAIIGHGRKIALEINIYLYFNWAIFACIFIIKFMWLIAFSFRTYFNFTKAINTYTIITEFMRTIDFRWTICIVY